MNELAQIIGFLFMVVISLAGVAWLIGYALWCLLGSRRLVRIPAKNLTKLADMYHGSGYELRFIGWEIWNTHLTVGFVHMRRIKGFKPVMPAERSQS